MSDINAGNLFKLPPEKIIAYLAARGYIVNKNWEEIFDKAQEQAFYISGVMKEDIIKDAKAIIDRGISEGKTFNSIKEEFASAMQAKGWEASTFRLKTIYRVNTNIAYSVGRYQEQLEVADFANVWVYTAIMDANTRLEHAELNGKAFRPNDKFWNYFYPPNGYNCRCKVRAMTEGRAKRKGITVENSKGKITTVKDQGKTTHAYNNVKCDVGWDKNLGKEYLKENK